MRVLGAVFVLNAGLRQEIATTFRKEMFRNDVMRYAGPPG